MYEARCIVPFLQRKGRSISDEVLENSDVGEHEDADVKNERQRVFNLVSSSAVQEPPVVLMQVSYYLEVSVCVCVTPSPAHRCDLPLPLQPYLTL